MNLSGTQFDFVTLVIQDQTKLNDTLSVAFGPGTAAERAQGLVDLADSWDDFDEFEPHDALDLIEGPFTAVQGSARQTLLELLATDSSKWTAFATQYTTSSSSGDTWDQYVDALTSLAQSWVTNITRDDIRWLADLVADVSPGDKSVLVVAGVIWMT